MGPSVPSVRVATTGQLFAEHRTPDRHQEAPQGKEVPAEGMVNLLPDVAVAVAVVEAVDVEEREADRDREKKRNSIQ